MTDRPVRRVLRVGLAPLDEQARARVFDRLRAAVTDDEVAATWIAVDLLRLAKTIDTWQAECWRSSTPAPPAPTESANFNIKSIRRAARGLRNYSATIRLHAGQPGRVPTTTRIRSYSFTTEA